MKVSTIGADHALEQENLETKVSAIGADHALEQENR